MPSALKFVQGLEIIALKYSWLAITQHIAILLLAFCFWVYRERVSWLLSLYFALTAVAVGALALVENNNVVTCAVFGIIAIMFFAELISPEMDYTTKRLKWYNLTVALLSGCYALWYPVSGDYFYSLISSPYGILPTPTLLVFLAFFIISLPDTNKKLHGFLIVCSFYYGMMGSMRLEIYWDIPLAFVALYSLVMVNMSRDKANR